MLLFESCRTDFMLSFLKEFADVLFIVVIYFDIPVFWEAFEVVVPCIALVEKYKDAFVGF